MSGKRSAHYTLEETECLLSHLEANPGLLEAKKGVQFQSTAEYNLAWEEVAEKVTYVGGYFGTKRSGVDLKRKWTDLKHRVKAKIAKIENFEGKGRPASLTATDRQVLTLMNQVNDLQEEKNVMKNSKGLQTSSVRVFSFPNDSNSQDGVDPDEGSGSEPQEPKVILTEAKSLSNEEKKRRISEAFTTSSSEKSPSAKRMKPSTEEEQLLELCVSQRQIYSEMSSIKDILKKSQLSVEKLCMLKKAELKLKCAKHGVDYEDLFD